MKTTLLVLGVLFIFAQAASAFYMADSSSATMTVGCEVQEINELSVSSDTICLTVDTATAGSEPAGATCTATYDITTNCVQDGKKITGRIDADMPEGLTLKVAAEAPTGAVSAGEKVLSTTPTDLVTGIDAVAESGLGLTFRLETAVEAGAAITVTRTFTMTITDS
ncbi:MAG: hypothetical protein J7M38_06820 [Armatimonadetes bacterium]|nr:hypothetical protein [Armatimonadota bacterium]